MPHSQGPPLAELLPPLSDHEALVEANRCIFCYDAPCTHACPTHIDIPRFIKKIATGNNLGSARTILDANLLGATCARVCPVQELCEGACVLGAEHKPIMIGRLQRYAMDYVYSGHADVFSRASATGKKIAVVGAGAAGLSCAGELAKRGHDVTVLEKRDLAGGLSTYGIIGLREPVPIALAEIEMIRSLGVEFRTGVELCRDVKLADLLSQFDAVFLSMGLGATPLLEIPGEEYIVDGLRYIEQSKLDPSRLEVGARVIVIGAGNTAIDCATIARRLGAEQVTIAYRRSENEVSAYRHEMEFIRKEGVEFSFLTQPVKVRVREGRVLGLECVRMSLGELDATGRPTAAPLPGSEFFMAADQVVKAIGQERPPLAVALGLATKRGYIDVNAEFETSIPKVFAGGDCIRAVGACSTVMAVEDGKLAALAIAKRLAI
ncbi:MAG TPA: NAD(P)-dependent oxidoreductase [Bryobacteraceae bacterium]|jgi:glutamate synthase (NADPH/NADH) small chain|nr:NAD(P)-dependent oxidoreductase [Bryobacteraceae bacterium]